jgi:C_GCAxxG_C_C family probable redox protein
MKTHFASEAQKTAEELFASGFHCAQSVIVALAKSNKVESNLLAQIATGFCGGMARTCGTCGALSAAVMGMGLKFGCHESDMPVDQCYLATQRLISQFEQEFGSRECHVLLGCDLGTTEGQATFRDNQLRVQCANIVSRSTQIAAEIIAEFNG